MYHIMKYLTTRFGNRCEKGGTCPTCPRIFGGSAGRAGATFTTESSLLVWSSSGLRLLFVSASSRQGISCLLTSWDIFLSSRLCLVQQKKEEHKNHSRRRNCPISLSAPTSQICICGVKVSTFASY